MPARSRRKLQADIEQLSRSSNRLRSIFTKRPRSQSLHLRLPPLSPSGGRAAPDIGLTWASPRAHARGSPRSMDLGSWSDVGGLSVPSPGARAPAVASPSTGSTATSTPALPRQCDVEKLRCTATDEGLSATESSDELLCSVCLEDVCVGDDTAVLPCGHLYHYSCVRGWILAKGCCPNCRRCILQDIS